MEITPVTPIPRSDRAARSDEQHQQQRAPAPPATPATDVQTSRFEVVTEDGNQIVYRAVDPETGIVLAQVPSEEVRRVAKRLEEMIAEGTMK
jgi:uncharacterized FlaG/YvyC family protein